MRSEAPEQINPLHVHHSRYHLVDHLVIFIIIIILTLLITSSLLQVLTPVLASLVLGVGVLGFLVEPGRTMGPHSRTQRTYSER